MTGALLAAGEVWTNPILVGLVVGIPTSALGVVAYRRAEKLDQSAVQSAVVAAQGDAVQRVIDGLDRIIDNLQVDNKEVRQRVVDLTKRLTDCNDELKRVGGSSS